MAVPANIVCAWPGTVVSIPTGWSRVTELDSRFLQGAAAGADTDLVTDRGNTSHTHTSAAHTPIQVSHSHQMVGSITGTQKQVAGSGLSVGSHTHSISITSFVIATNNSSTVNFGANSSNDPPYIAVIWIKSDGNPTGIPGTAYAFFESDSLPSGWSRVAADSYLKGAATGLAGGATGGALTHTHVSDSHTHTQNAHTHGTATTLTTDLVDSFPSDDGTGVNASHVHTHDVTTNSTTATNQATTNTSSADNHEPLYKKLNTIANGGSADLPNNLIAVYIGSNGSIPAGWSRYTALDGYFLKGANAGEGLVAGGSQTHTHTAVCQPTQNNHNHTATGTDVSGTASGDEIFSGSVIRSSSSTHNHAWTITGVIPGNTALTYNVDACSSEAAYPKYRRVIFVRFGSATPAASKPCYTSYDLAQFDVSWPVNLLDPARANRIGRGNNRYREEGDSYGN